jgi:heptaprenyl diphosphate synthase
MKTKKLTVLALSVALAMILSFIESQIPSFVPIPGVKIGLANIVVVFALYKLGWKEAAGISLLRVFLVSVLFGHAASFFYSIAGALLSFCGMALLKRTGLFSHIAVSVAGGVLHNVGQILMACILLETNIITYYLPVLILSGTLAGIVIGLLASVMVSRIRLDIEPDEERKS